MHSRYDNAKLLIKSHRFHQSKRNGLKICGVGKDFEAIPIIITATGDGAILK